jgi:hypothetical protein
VRAASALLPTLTDFRYSLCSHECEHGTHECVRHILPRTCSSSTLMGGKAHGHFLTGRGSVSGFESTGF